MADASDSAPDVQPMLAFLICGSAGAGKSTLVEGLIEGGQPLSDEQATGSTFAGHFFSAAWRRFVAIEAADHTQTILDVVTGLPPVDAVVIVVDVTTDATRQVRRHLFTAHLLGIRHVVIAVNKLDLAGDAQQAFSRVVGEIGRDELFGPDAVQCIPMSVRVGDDVASSGGRMRWYGGPTMIGYLESIPPVERADAAFRMPVERTDPDSLDITGVIASGTVRPGTRLVSVSTGETVTIRSIAIGGRMQGVAMAGQSVSLIPEEDVVLRAGDVLSAPDDRPAFSDQFCAHIVWMDASELLPGRPYIVKLGAKEVLATVTRIKYTIDIETRHHQPAATVKQDNIAVCNVSLHEPVVFDAYATSRELGGFTIIDRGTGTTLGAGMIDFALRRTSNLRWQKVDVTKTARAGLKEQQPVVLWFTGLSAAGKSTIANIVEKKLFASGFHTYLLDGDNLRHGINRDLGFTEADRVENIRRVAEIARLMTDAGLIVLTSFISPFRAERQMARELFAIGEFVEIFVDVSLEVAEARDPKGLYRRARNGQLKNFTGIDSPYEVPQKPDIRLEAALLPAEELAEQVLDFLEARCTFANTTRR